MGLVAQEVKHTLKIASKMMAGCLLIGLILLPFDGFMQTLPVWLYWLVLCILVLPVYIWATKEK